MINMEDVNDSSTWNLDLIRKHELAETDDYQVVYRRHDGKIVNWGEAATQYANLVIEHLDQAMQEVVTQVGDIEEHLNKVERDVDTLTDEAETSVRQSQASANLAKDWATKTSGMVQENGVNVDYSSKYYANQSHTYQTQAASSASNAQSSANVAVTYAGQARNSATQANKSANDANAAKVQVQMDAQQVSSDKAWTAQYLNDTRGYAANAQTSANNAATSEENAQGYKDDAMQYAIEAQTSKNSAAISETAARQANTSAQAAVEEAQELLDEFNSYIAASTVNAMWDSSVTYVVGDCVMTPDGSTYRCIQESTNDSPSTSPEYWAIVQLTQLATFEYDEHGDLMPLINPANSPNWQIDENGDIVPAA